MHCTAYFNTYVSDTRMPQKPHSEQKRWRGGRMITQDCEVVQSEWSVGGSRLCVHW